MVSGDKRRRKPQRAQPTGFDEDASSRFAARVLHETGVPGAVVGRYAIWAWVPLQRQAMTKDLDLAVAVQNTPFVRAFLERASLLNRVLTIGGVNARHEATGVNVDFIDRSNREWGDLSALYAEAIAAAYETGLVYSFHDVTLPLAPPEYIVVMKLATQEHDDEKDAKSLLMSDEAQVGIDIVRDIVTRHVPLLRATLERVLREIGHPLAVPAPDLK